MANVKRSILNYPNLDKDRVWKKIGFVLDSECWVWIGHIDKSGYGIFSMYSGMNMGAHRVVYELINGAIDKTLEMDHLCRNRCCVNPDHLEPVTNKENQHRGMGWAGKNYRKTHCTNGHRYDDIHTYRIGDYGRRCRTCNAAGARKYRKRLREQQNA